MRKLRLVVLAGLALGACGDSIGTAASTAAPAGSSATPHPGGNGGALPGGGGTGSAATGATGTGAGPVAGGATGAAAGAGQGSLPEAGTSSIENPWGFALRLPQTHVLDCSLKMVEEMPAQQVSDADQICTFSHDGMSGHVYLEATAVDCEYYYALVGLFSTRAWLSIQGEVIALEDARYSLGGDHFTDSLSFTYAGRYYYYWHSSFATNYRSCQPMHCMRVYDGASPVHDATTLIEDGCTAERTLPVVCVAVRSDGSVPPLEDRFAPCPDGLTAPEGDV